MRHLFKGYNTRNINRHTSFRDCCILTKHPRKTCTEYTHSVLILQRPLYLNQAGYIQTRVTLFLDIREHFRQVGKRQKLWSEAWLVSAGECKALRSKGKTKTQFCRFFSGIHSVETNLQQNPETSHLNSLVSSYR